MRPVIFVISLICALLAWQIPEFGQQYSQRLGGALDELDRIVQHFDEDSRQSGYDEADALGLMAKNPEPLVREQSARMSENIQRRNRLRDQKVAVAAGGLGGIIVLLTSYDPPLAERTYSDFRPGLPLTFDGLFFALGGFVVSFLMLVFAGGAVRTLAEA
jgi:hypothetical protein